MAVAMLRAAMRCPTVIHMTVRRTQQVVSQASVHAGSPAVEGPPEDNQEDPKLRFNQVLALY